MSLTPQAAAASKLFESMWTADRPSLMTMAYQNDAMGELARDWLKRERRLTIVWHAPTQVGTLAAPPEPVHTLTRQDAVDPVYSAMIVASVLAKEQTEDKVRRSRGEKVGPRVSVKVDGQWWRVHPNLAKHLAELGVIEAQG